MNDNCPRTSYNPPRPTWISDSVTDMDGDGCRDSDEDLNDDGDAFDDSFDDVQPITGLQLKVNKDVLIQMEILGLMIPIHALQFGNSSANGKLDV